MKEHTIPRINNLKKKYLNDLSVLDMTNPRQKHPYELLTGIAFFVRRGSRMSQLIQPRYTFHQHLTLWVSLFNSRR
jgi:hypothetical protein